MFHSLEHHKALDVNDPFDSDGALPKNNVVIDAAPHRTGEQPNNKLLRSS